MSINKVLIVDDEAIVRDFLLETLTRKGIDTTAAEDGYRALELLRDNEYDLIITDMKMPGITGIDLLKKSKELYPRTIVVVITAYATVENAVEAMRLGAFNYLLKPFTPETIETIIDKAGEHLSIMNENTYHRRQASRPESEIVIVSSSMKKIVDSLSHIAQSNASVMITGESGTGKEVIAQAIHSHSKREQGPYIKVNCAAVPETLIESEFFGHEKGAFTGAHAKRLGRFELADQGTLLLDEVTEVPTMLQAKLLRAIQEQEFERVGGNKPIKVNVRIVATSNRDMQEAIVNRVLREDLYYRLNVIPIHILPLREREEDIIPLAKYFIDKTSRNNHRSEKQLSRDAMDKLLKYNWPGNVRELGNVIERAVVIDNGREIKPEHLLLNTQTPIVKDHRLPVGMSIQELEKQLIIETLRDNKYNRTHTAEILGISVRTLRNKLHEYQLTHLKPGTVD
jgi:two-component system response regulator AtoC